jgi:hypothetical protein
MLLAKTKKAEEKYFIHQHGVERPEEKKNLSSCLEFLSPLALG